MVSKDCQYLGEGWRRNRQENSREMLQLSQRFAFNDLGEAANKSAYGNGASIFTSSGAAAREFKHRVKAGMVGINVGVPATMAMFPFTGWDASFYGDLHIQGREAVQFYTRQKVVTARWFGGAVDDVWRK